MALALLLLVLFFPSLAYTGKCPTGFGFYYSHGKPLYSYKYEPSCYKFVTDFDQVDTWMGAWRKCRALGAYLVSIETAGEQHHLQAVMNAHSQFRNPKGFSAINFAGYWTSGSDRAKEGAWKWQATGRSLTFTNWSAPQPDNYGPHGENCLQMFPGSSKWNDAPCYYQFMSYICEKRA